MSRYIFTTLPSNDLGLLTQSLPIARELRNREHQVAFCSPGKAPVKSISDAGFDNLLPSQPLYYLISGAIRLGRLSRILLSNHLKRDVGILISFIKHISKNSTAEIWNIDHFMYLFGMWNDGFIRVNVDALVELICTYKPDAILDFLNPFTCIAAKVIKKKLITVIQSDMHPQSQGLKWWKKAQIERPPSPVPATNRALAKYNLPPVEKMGELLIGDMTLVLGLPETDLLPETADISYTGPVLWQRRQEQLQDWINDLGREQPVIWLYPGNLQYVKGLKSYQTILSQ